MINFSNKRIANVRTKILFQYNHSPIKMAKSPNFFLKGNIHCYSEIKKTYLH